jgi:hypothetical protein
MAAASTTLGRLRMDKLPSTKMLARCLVLFDRVSYISIRGARVVVRRTTSLALEASITFRLHGVTVLQCQQGVSCQEPDNRSQVSSVRSITEQLDLIREQSVDDGKI